MSLDDRASAATESARRSLDRIDVPEPAALVARDRRRRRARALAAGGLVVLLGTTVGAVLLRRSPETARVSADAGGPAGSVTAEQFSLRAVSGVIPSPCSEVTGSEPAGDNLFPDRTGKRCYMLAPPSLTAEIVEMAAVTSEADPGHWAVLLILSEEGRRDFEDFVRAHAGQQAAVVVDGRVVTAPMIEEGVDSRMIPVHDDFTEAEARDVASTITGLPPDEIRDAADPPSGPTHPDPEAARALRVCTDHAADVHPAAVVTSADAFTAGMTVALLAEAGAPTDPWDGLDMYHFVAWCSYDLPDSATTGTTMTDCGGGPYVVGGSGDAALLADEDGLSAPLPDEILGPTCIQFPGP